MKIGIRNSKLSICGAEEVRRFLAEKAPEQQSEIVFIQSSGDRRQSLPDELRLKNHDKRMWIDGHQDALISGEIDCAIHCSKDVPVDPHPDTIIMPVSTREFPEDVLVCKPGAGMDNPPGGLTLAGLHALPQGAVVGTASKRRSAQLRYYRPDLQVIPLTGNVDTRLKKLSEHEMMSTAVLAHAGLARIQRADAISYIFSPNDFVPAMNQGILAAQIHRSRHDLIELFSALSIPEVLGAWEAERACITELGADCHSAVGVYASYQGGVLSIVTRIFSADGTRMLEDIRSGEGDPVDLGRSAGQAMLSQGAAELLGECLALTA